LRNTCATVVWWERGGTPFPNFFPLGNSFLGMSEYFSLVLVPTIDVKNVDLKNKKR